MDYTAYLSPQQCAWRGDVDDPTDGEFVGQFFNDVQENILYRRIESLQLNHSTSRTLTFAVSSLQAEWVFLIAKVVGSAEIVTAGLDTDGVTSIAANLNGSGTSNFPGFIVLSSYNLTSVTVTSLADGTTIDLFAAIACADNDSRLISNA